MIKGRKIRLDAGPLCFSEDIYLCTEFGQIINRRERYRREIRNIFEIFSPAEESFVLRSMKLGTRPLLFAISELGPVFIDITVLRSYGIMALIVPSVLPEESVAIAFGPLRSEVFPSDKARKLAAIFGTNAEVESALADRMQYAYGNIYSFDFGAHTNSEAADYLSDKVADYGALFGAELKFAVKAFCESESSSTVELSSFLYALMSFALICREYSSQRNGRVDVFFDESGAYFDLGFKIVSEKRGERLTFSSREVSDFKRTAENKKLVCIFYQNEDSFVIRVFPWSVYPVGNETKKPAPEFDY